MLTAAVTPMSARSIFTIPKLGVKLKQDVTPLSYTPRRFVSHPTSKVFYVIESDHRTHSPSALKRIAAENVCPFRSVCHCSARAELCSTSRRTRSRSISHQNSSVGRGLTPASGRRASAWLTRLSRRRLPSWSSRTTRRLSRLLSCRSRAAMARRCSLLARPRTRHSHRGHAGPVTYAPTASPRRAVGSSSFTRPRLTTFRRLSSRSMASSSPASAKRFGFTTWARRSSSGRRRTTCVLAKGCVLQHVLTAIHSCLSALVALPDGDHLDQHAGIAAHCRRHAGVNVLRRLQAAREQAHHLC